MMMPPKEILLFLLDHKWENVMTPQTLIQLQVPILVEEGWGK